MSSARILITGYFGFGNAGDEAILASMLAHLREARPGAEITVVSRAPGETTKSYGVESVFWRDVIALDDAAREADLLIVGGGGVFHDYWGFPEDSMLSDGHWGLAYYAAPAVLALLHRKPLMLYAVGVGPLETERGRHFTKAACDVATAITVRDDESKEELVALGVPPERVEVTADPAFAYEPQSAAARLDLAPALGGARPLLGVALRHWDVGVVPEAWESEAAAALDTFLLATDGRVLFLPFQEESVAIENDAAVALRVRQRMRESSRTTLLAGERSPARLAALVAQCDLVLAMRLHAGVFAARAGVPVVALDYDPKVTRLMRQIGQRDAGLSLATLTRDALARSLADAFEERGRYGRQVADAAARLSKSARRTAELASELLDAPAAARRPPTPEVDEILSDALRAQLRTVRSLRGGLLESSRRGDALAARLADRERAYDALSAEKQRVTDTLTAEKLRLTDALRAAERRTEDEIRRGQREASFLQSQLGDVRNEVLAIHRSRYWKLLSRYWSLRRRIRELFQRKPASAGERADAPPSAGASVSRAPAPRAARRPPSPAPIARENAYDVVCLPIIDWDFRYQRPQQLMARFAEAGHRVFYVAQKFRPDGEPYEIRSKRDNVYEVSLRGPERNVYRQALDEAARDALFAGLDALRRDLSLGATALFVQLPFWWPLARRAREELAWPVLYDCMDDHSGFTTNNPEMVAHEKELTSSADLVVASSGVLDQRARAANRNVLLLPNACDADHFGRVSDRAPNPRPVVGYYGAIANWFDANLVADLAERRTDWDFVLVGSTYTGDTSRLATLPNVDLPGEKPYDEIPEWLQKFDVAILPFRRVPLTEATSPVKAFEILAGGKPLVSVPIPEVVPMAPLVRLASSAEEFEREIDAALREAETDPDAPSRRRAFALGNTWARRFEELEPRIRALFPKASIVVVTFHNLELNRLCLESVYSRTEWPNFEVLVVDNASADGTVAYLRDAAKRLPNLTVIANSENRGFAAANNQGLARASGDTLVLLNNDTVVTRGWLSALIRHLAADPKLGLIGPSTNAIANEAKVEVGYGSVEELPAWAENFVRENDGRVFAIPMLAMFCLAVRRAVFEQVGPLDERFGVGMFEDDDYNRRVREKGWEIRCARDAFVHHWQKASFKRMGEKEYLELFEANRKKYEEKWGEAWKAEGVDVWKRADLGFYREQLAAVRARVAESKGAVVFLPSVGWGIHLFQRPHHLARTLARTGYVALFDSSNAHDDVNGFKEIEPNLFLFRGPDGLLEQMPDPVLWAFPYNFHKKDGYPASARVVYDWIDDLEVFPYDRDLLERNHTRALEEAAVVASVARKLHEQAVAVRPDAVYVPNGVEFERFSDDSVSIPDDRELRAFRESGKPIAGYYGALAEWFDYRLLDDVARERPDWNFLLIGPMYDQSLRGQPMLKRSNVLWIGPRDYHSLPGYLKLFDVATIPFQINNITTATSPLKLFEYFAAGKPAVTTPMRECMAFPEVAISRDAAEFAAALDPARAKGREPAFRERLRELGRENSWSARVDTVLEALGEARRAKSPPHPDPLAHGRGRGELPVSSPPRTGERQGEGGPDGRFRGMSSIPGRCNVCGKETRFYYSDPLLYRESLTCAHCLTTSRYRSVARGILKAVRDLAGVEAPSLTDLAGARGPAPLAVYDTQVPFYGDGNAYPIPDLLARCSWLRVTTSRFDPRQKPGKRLRDHATNQNLEALTFPDASFDVVITSDVLEHVRLDARAHREIRRVLKPGGVYLFTVPHFRDRKTLVRVDVTDPDDPAADRDLTEREYHGDANSEEGRALSYRSYGTDLDDTLGELGFRVDYTKDDFPELGIRNTELFYCRLSS